MNITNVSKEFAADLIELINSLKNIKYNARVNYNTKNGKVTQFEYVTLDKIYSEIKKNNNFAVLEPLGTNEKGESAIQIILIHKAGEAITSDYYKLRVSDVMSKQDEGSAITYTKRYALGSFLGICTDEDNDASNDKPAMIKAQESIQLSDKQIVRLYAKAKAASIEEDTLKKVINKKYSKNSTKELSKKEYDEICEHLDCEFNKQVEIKNKLD